jgi:NOL1/NOP2/sun family putative RNA methylase
LKTALFESYRDVIPDFSGFQESLRRALPVHLRINSLKIEPGVLMGILEEKGIHLERIFDEEDTLFWAPGIKTAGRMIEYFLGYVHPQALTSCLASIVLSPAPHSLVLDMCAAPGGKTSHLAQLMKNRGIIVANELDPSRHIPLNHTLGRLGVLNSVVTAYQAQEFPLKQRFDFILADVPCSGEGTFRMTAKRTCYREKRHKAKLPELQKKILLRAFDLLKEGGQMVYSTCTYDPDENEAVVDSLLRYRDAEILPVESGLRHQPGLCAWGKAEYDKQLRRAARFYPHEVDSVGFFMARIGRRR